MPHVIGTAGHVDHGKSALVRALTGIDPDRLAEEKARGLTIDLGFAWTTLPSGREVGFVDVPGHERFVHNMLAGVGGIGCALLVVDASEGWRPQSAEHLAILDLLGIPGGVVALTKVDLVDRATRDRVAGAVRGRLQGTALAGAELVATAAPSGVGIDELAAALDRALDRLPEPPDRGRPRLPVDRVFTMRGSGTVVTGTLSGGSLRADGEAELLPAGRRARVRGLQGHGRPLAEAAPARRVAVNLAGIATDEVSRGDVLVLPGQWAATSVADVRLRCLAGAPGPLRARGAYLVYAGAAETAARLQPLDATEVPPGGDALVRLHLERPLVLDVFEPVVLRDSGRDETVGGGLVLDPFPPGAVRGTSARVRRAEELEAREAAGRAGLLERVLAERAVVPLADLPRLAATAPGRLPPLPTSGAPEPPDPGAAGTAVIRSRTLAWSRPAWEAAAAAVLEAVRRQHHVDPSAPGLPAQAAREVARAAAQTATQPWATPSDLRATASDPLATASDPGTAASDPLGAPPTDPRTPPTNPRAAATDPAPGSALRRGSVAEREIGRPRLSTALPAASLPATSRAAAARPPTSRAAAARSAAARPVAAQGVAVPAVVGSEVVEVLVAEGRLVADGPAVRLPGHAERLDPAQQALVDRVERAAGAVGVGLLGEAALAELGADRKATALLVRIGVLVRVAPGGYLGRSALEGAVETLRRSFPDGRPFAATEAKEALGTTRRTAIPLLEHLDRTGVTVRQGDLRRLTGRPLRPAG